MVDKGSLSVRSYTLAQDAHAHRFHQIVIPLSGAMEIAFGGSSYSVAVGHCVIIPGGTVHTFSAPEASRFLVTDLDELPPNATGLEEPCVPIGADLMAFSNYAEVQLTSAADDALRARLFDLFYHLIAQR